VFRDDSQAARAVRALLGFVGLADLWTEEGPTDVARAGRRKQRNRTREQLRHRLPKLTPEQRVLMFAAWSFWTLHRPEPGRSAGLREVVAIGPPLCRLAIGQLIAALSFDPPERWEMIDGWIGCWGQSRPTIEAISLPPGDGGGA